MKTVSALTGHRFPGHGEAAIFAWRLSRSQWLFVVNRVDRHEEGWRRRRGLSILRRIARVRRDLKFPISRVLCSACWVGSGRGRELVLGALRELIGTWRRAFFGACP